MNFYSHCRKIIWTGCYHKISTANCFIQAKLTTRENNSVAVVKFQEQNECQNEQTSHCSYKTCLNVYLVCFGSLSMSSGNSPGTIFEILYLICCYLLTICQYLYILCPTNMMASIIKHINEEFVEVSNSSRNQWLTLKASNIKANNQIISFVKSKGSS